MNYQPITRSVCVAGNLHAERFEDVDVNLFELYAACAERTGLITGRNFVRCRIQGPAIMLVSAGDKGLQRGLHWIAAGSTTSSTSSPAIVMASAI